MQQCLWELIASNHPTRGDKSQVSPHQLSHEATSERQAFWGVPSSIGRKYRTRTMIGPDSVGPSKRVPESRFKAIFQCRKDVLTSALQTMSKEEPSASRSNDISLWISDSGESWVTGAKTMKMNRTEQAFRSNFKFLKYGNLEFRWKVARIGVSAVFVLRKITNGTTGISEGSSWERYTKTWEKILWTAECNKRYQAQRV